MATIDTATLLTTAEAAGILDLSTDSVKIYCQKGQIDGIKIGHIWMIPKAEVMRYKRERKPIGRPESHG